MKTILITGCSSGFGLETAKHFLANNWKVIATMRTPDTSQFPSSDRLTILPLDVTSEHSIEQVIEQAGPIDVLVNNAGIGMLGPVEGTPMAIARTVFETNTIGTMAMTKAVIPQFRERRAGLIINVTSSVTLKSLPLLAIYTGSKAAINAFTESLALELAQFNIRVRLVLPGRSPTTRFGENAQARMQQGFNKHYASFLQGVFDQWQQDEVVTHTDDVVQAIWQVANEQDTPMRIAAGADAKALIHAAD
ncbi:Dihydroanticapsin 7-dehydrogenase [Thalassocella blandensis]|nr:Dihydroanticapsin 7-dehydrogenase [Thalassocella blandensis]